MTDNNNFQNIDWLALIDDLNSHRLVPFVGAGASLGHNGSAGLPGGSELARALAKKCGFPGKDNNDLLRVAQFFALRRGETYSGPQSQDKKDVYLRCIHF